LIEQKAVRWRVLGRHRCHDDVGAGAGLGYAPFTAPTLQRNARQPRDGKAALALLALKPGTGGGLRLRRKVTIILKPAPR
jgi:hypothetical protein